MTVPGEVLNKTCAQRHTVPQHSNKWPQQHDSVHQSISPSVGLSNTEFIRRIHPWKRGETKPHNVTQFDGLKLIRFLQQQNLVWRSTTV